MAILKEARSIAAKKGMSFKNFVECKKLDFPADNAKANAKAKAEAN